MKKILGLVVALVMVTLLVSGCFLCPTTEGAYRGRVLEDGTLELTVHYLGVGGAFQNDWPVFTAATDITAVGEEGRGVRLRGTVPSSAASTEDVMFFNLMVASQQFPDIIQTTRENFDLYSDEVFLPLEDLIERYAPNIARFFEENPDARRTATASDGSIYFIPRMTAATTAQGWFIRQDWLDELGLEVPTTVVEFEAALRAFMTLGDDIVPFLCRHQNVNSLVMLYGVRYGWQIQPNGMVIYSRYHPQYRVAMENLARWYDDGLIDQEIFSRGGTARDVLFAGNRGGATHDWLVSTAGFNLNESILEQVPGFNLVAMSPPANPFGVRAEMTSRPLAEPFGWGISNQNQFVRETMEYLDFWFSEEGMLLYQFGVEGEHWAWGEVDGERMPIVDADILASGLAMNEAIWEIGGGIWIGSQQDFRFEAQWMSEAARVGMQLYIDGDYMLPQFPQLSFTEEEASRYSTLWPAIEARMLEQEIRWITGFDPVNDATWNSYIEDLRTLGMAEVLAIYQAALERYNEG